MNARLLASAILAALNVSAAYAAQAVPYLPVPHDAAVVMNTGSTNTLGYRIVITRAGSAQWVMGTTRQTVQVSKQKTAALFNALSAAMPLSALPAAHCMKSASFGTSTFAYWRHQRSTDLECPADPRATEVYSSIAALVVELGIGKRTIPMLPNEPRRPMPQPSST